MQSQDVEEKIVRRRREGEKILFRLECVSGVVWIGKRYEDCYGIAYNTIVKEKKIGVGEAAVERAQSRAALHTTRL